MKIIKILTLIALKIWFSTLTGIESDYRGDDPDTIIEELETNMLTFLYLMVIFGKIGGEESDLFAAMKIIHFVVAEVNYFLWNWPKLRETLINKVPSLMFI